MTTSGPAVPTFILRGHEAPIHALVFLADNALLASGDSDGWMVLWSLTSKRPAAVWKAHAGGVSTIFAWDAERVISHGRDHKLRVWQLPKSLDNLSQKVPADGASDDQPLPWILHAIDMSALNFCSFSACHAFPKPGSTKSLLIASPNGLDHGGIDVFRLPAERRVCQIRSDKVVNTGMVMSVAIVADETTAMYHILAGYEDGQISLYSLTGTGDEYVYQRLALIKAHSQPVLSLSPSPDSKTFVTTSADAQISQFSLRIETSSPSCNRLRLIDTKHAGQQGLSIRSDGKLFATAGWDARVRLYSMKTMKELAVLKWHTAGCFVTAFADLSEQNQALERQAGPDASALDIIRRERTTKAQTTHWLAAGGKDGKISLWDVY